LTGWDAPNYEHCSENEKNHPLKVNYPISVGREFLEKFEGAQ
jgi:hypothetical protein